VSLSDADGVPQHRYPTPFLVGARVHLRALQESDARGLYPDWFNDEEVCRSNSHHVFPFTEKDALDYIRGEANGPRSLVLAVVIPPDGRHLGNIALEEIHPIYRSAEFAILMGERSAWGKGYAAEAAELLCAHGFGAMNLHRISCGTFADNEGMVRLAERLGMREEGRRRQAAFKAGRYVDVIEFGLLRNEFERRRGAAIRP
jgi:RimJ/RimL family protein N-acetyltransferase